MIDDRRLEQARLLYERAIFGGDSDALAQADAELDGVEADLALARGRILHVRFFVDGREDPRELRLFERATQLYRDLGDVRGEGEALFWTGTFHQVVRKDTAAARPLLERSYELALEAGDKLMLSYAARHLGFAAADAGELETARERLEESVRLRQEVGFAPGVAAGMLALAQLAAEAGNRDEALELLEEAHVLAQECEAAGVLRWVEEAQAEL